MPTVDPLRAKALSCLRDGRVSVLRVVSDLDTLTQREVTAVVRSSRGNGRQYVVDLHKDGRWTCTCPAGIAGEASCAHRAAVLLITTQGAAA